MKNEKSKLEPFQHVPADPGGQLVVAVGVSGVGRLALGNGAAIFRHETCRGSEQRAREELTLVEFHSS